MSALMKALHALSAALLFGSVAFFTFAGLLMVNAFEKEALADPRPAWFPLAKEYAGDGPDGFPVPLRKEQGSRAFGVAVGSLFTFYFALQTGCAALALMTASAVGGRLRVVLCAAVLASVLVGWWLERVVHGLREERSRLTDAVLKVPSDESIEKALAARKAFGVWHQVSLVANFGTLGLAAWLAALAAFPKRES